MLDKKDVKAFLDLQITLGVDKFSVPKDMHELVVECFNEFEVAKNKCLVITEVIGDLYLVKMVDLYKPISSILKIEDIKNRDFINFHLEFDILTINEAILFNRLNDRCKFTVCINSRERIDVLTELCKKAGYEVVYDEVYSPCELFLKWSDNEK